MPFAIVETVDSGGRKKLLVVPEPWIECKLGQGEYLRWPDAKCIRNLKELLDDDQSSPSASWETRECKIICEHVASRSSGEKTIEIIHSSSSVTAKAISKSIIKPRKPETVNVQSVATTSNAAPSRETLILVEETQPSENMQALLCDIIPKEELEDPFEDIACDPALTPAAATDPTKQAHLNASIVTERQKNEQQLMALFGFEESAYDPPADLGPSQESSQQSRNVSEMSSVPIQPAKKPRLGVVDAKQWKDDAQRFFSGPRSEPEGATAGEINSFSELIDMVWELKRMMKMHQKEIKKMVSNGLSRMNRTVSLLLEKKVTTAQSTASLSDDDDTYKFEPLKTREAVEMFDERLKDEAYRKQIHDWVDDCVHHESSPKHRMHDMIDLIFERQLFAKFCWSGRGGKYAFRQYENILQLFAYIGGTDVERMTSEELEDYFKKKLSHSDSRKNLTSTTSAKLRKTPALRAFIQNSNSGLKNDTLAQPTKPSQLTNVEKDRVEHGSSKQNEGIEHDKASLGEGMDPGKTIPQDKNSSARGQPPSLTAGAAQAPAEEILPEININPVQTMAQMDWFETALANERQNRQVKRWVDKTVGQIADSEQRIKMLLERLIEKNFLINFCWLNTSSGKRSLADYKNVVRLFEYACRTVLFNTVVLNHGLVSNFFAKTLDHVS